MIQAAVFGATGYTGLELVRILAAHPGVEVRMAASESQAGGRLSAVHPTAPDLPLVSPEEALKEASGGGLDVAFLCLPHAASARTAARLVAAGVRVIDLSADFRLRDPQLYARWYGGEHPAPELLEEAVYGLTEHARPALAGARLVANPGCYATSVLLPLTPLVAAGAVAGPVIADSKSGVSGAGRAPKAHTHFVEVAENFSPYGIGRAHRHLPEMEQQLAAHGWQTPALVFSPHLLPVARGILSTIYVSLAEGWSAERAREVLERAYAGETFVHLLPAGEVATLAHAVRTNRCVIGTLAVSPPGAAAPMLVITSALDNLVKGAAGQAVQNFNVVFGLPEAAGLAA